MREIRKACPCALRSTVTLTSLGIAAFVFFMPSASQAAWCANNLVGENCGFSSFETCMASISGVGGSCTQTRQAAPSAESAPKAQRPARKSAKPATSTSGR